MENRGQVEESDEMRHRQAKVGCRTQEMMAGLQCDCFEGEWTGVFKIRMFSKTPGLSGPAGTHLKPYLPHSAYFSAVECSVLASLGPIILRDSHL